MKDESLPASEEKFTCLQLNSFHQVYFLDQDQRGQELSARYPLYSGRGTLEAYYFLTNTKAYYRSTTLALPFGHCHRGNNKLTQGHCRHIANLVCVGLSLSLSAAWR